MRLDKYLKVSRLIKRRTVANEACDAGRVLVNDKPAKASVQVKTGDTVRLANADGAEAEFMVSGVCEHYVYNYAYLSATAYENGFGAAPEWNTVLTKLRRTRLRLSAYLEQEGLQ